MAKFRNDWLTKQKILLKTDLNKEKTNVFEVFRSFYLLQKSTCYNEFNFIKKSLGESFIYLSIFLKYLKIQ